MLNLKESKKQKSYSQASLNVSYLNDGIVKLLSPSGDLKHTNQKNKSMSSLKKNFKPIKNRSQALFTISNPYIGGEESIHDDGSSNIEVIHAKYPDHFKDDSFVEKRIKIQARDHIN